MASIGIEEARTEVAGMFMAYMGRAPEYEAMSYYVERLQTLAEEQGDGEGALDNAYLALSAEVYQSAQANGEIPSEVNSTNSEYVTWIYNNVLGRSPDEEGLNYWTEQLDSDTFSREDLLAVVIRSVQNQDPESRDAMFFNNRLEVALEFAKFENSNPNILADLQHNAADILAGVNEDPASVDAAKDMLYTATGGGESLVLTPGVDNLAGTSGDDVFSALPVNGADSTPATTLNQFDSLDGGAGRDTLNIYTDEAGNNTTQQGSVKNIEVINIFNNGTVFAGDAGVDASQFQGAEEIWQNNEATSVREVGDDVTVGFKDIEADSALAAEAADGTAELNLAFDNVAAAAGEGEQGGAGLVGVLASGENLDTVNLTGSLAPAAEGADEPMVVFGAVTGDAVDTVSINSEMDTWIVGAFGESVTTLDASGSTGDLLYVHGLIDEYRPAFIGGEGDDTVVAVDLGLNDSLDGGGGDNSLILLTDGEYQTEDYDAINQAQNFGNLAFVGPTIDVDAAQISSFTDLTVAGSDVTVDNLSAEQTIEVIDPAFLLDGGEDLDASAEGLLAQLGEQSGDSYATSGSLADAFAANSATTLALNNAAADVSVQVTGAIDLTLATGAGDDLGVTGGTLAVTGGQEAVAEGDAGSTLTYDNAEGKFSSIDVSEYVGEFSLLGMNADVAETVTLGAGSADSITLSVASAGESSSLYGAMDSIEGFEAGVDSLTLEGGTAEFLDFGGNQPGSLQEAFSLAAQSDLSSEDGVAVFHFDGNTYLYNDGDGAGAYDDGDFAVELVGVYSVEDLSIAEQTV
ncbi:DUF4214 domain-containing protein [Verticiella sediminum]|uniref:DUF4214 domain-containing protein n=1 Tax=Verticiella sediminum TaxID=1247510 RepID=A0A556AER9_9BURK|nr:DUF4214 domain-containing protein [Verticiella sediminum]TSH91386.1 DUF4214 domain-containing protein [Verticiella sediminum]